jgi:LCP family protein required for cell wall assembly
LTKKILPFHKEVKPSPMHSAKRFLLILLAFLPVACVLPSMIGGSSPAPVAVSAGPFLIEAPANATPTATPFQPLPPTPTYLPTHYPTAVPTLKPTKAPRGDIAKTWADYPGPTLWPDIDIPAPVGLLAQPAGQVNILLLGSDQRPNDGGFRTDTMVLLTLNPKAGTANMTSYPRDLYVYIPGWTVQRINTAFQHGGFEALALTFEYNFGVRPDYFALINFWSFTEVIDSLGGIDVVVETPLTDQRTGRGFFTMPAGVNHMDGETALWYVRSRLSTSDFERTQRQQEVVRAIFVKLLSLNAISRAPQLYQIYQDNVTTDLTLDVITPLLPLAAQVSDTSRINAYYIGRGQVIPWTNTNGAQVLLPIREKVLEVMRQALNSPVN